MPDLVKQVLDGARPHFDWCNPPEHDYETPEPECQQCRSTTTLAFPDLDERGDEVSSFAVELVSCPADAAHGVQPLAAIAFNGQIPGYNMPPWKLVPLAMALLAAEARSRGDVEMERAYLDAANSAIDARVAELDGAEQAGPKYVVAAGQQVIVRDRHTYDHIEDDIEPDAAQPVRHWSQGPFSYVQGGDPDDGLIPWDEYQAERSVEAGTPRYIVQHTTPGHHQVVDVTTGKSADGIVYDDFETACRERDLRNAEVAR